MISYMSLTLRRYQGSSRILRSMRICRILTSRGMDSHSLLLSLKTTIEMFSISVPNRNSSSSNHQPRMKGSPPPLADSLPKQQPSLLVKHRLDHRAESAQAQMIKFKGTQSQSSILQVEVLSRVAREMDYSLRPQLLQVNKHTRADSSSTLTNNHSSPCIRIHLIKMQLHSSTCNSNLNRGISLGSVTSKCIIVDTLRTKVFLTRITTKVVLEFHLNAHINSRQGKTCSSMHSEMSSSND